MNRADEITAAKTQAAAWTQRAEALDRVRLCELRAMTEIESARRFREWLTPMADAAPAVRASSGLVEQQRLFARLRR